MVRTSGVVQYWRPADLKNIDAAIRHRGAGNFSQHRCLNFSAARDSTFFRSTEVYISRRIFGAVVMQSAQQYSARQVCHGGILHRDIPVMS